MAGERETTTESQITADPDTIRSWGERHELTPVRYETGDEHRLDVVAESDRPSDAEELSWDEFGATLDRENKVVVRRGDAAADVDVVDRSEAVGRAPVEREDVAEALLEGEAVETDVTERRVVEHTVVQEATVQSEIVDREVVQSDVVDVELLMTDVDHATVTRTSPPAETPDAVERFQPGTRSDETYDVEIAVDEAWTLTREVVERIAIESRLVETDVEETETVESDTIEETADVEGVTETVLEGELVASPETAARAVESGHVESEFREDDVIETRLIRRQTIDEEMSVRKEITGEVSDAETLTTDAMTHTVVESEIMDADEYDVDLAAVEGDREGATADTAETTADTADTADTAETTADTAETATPTAESPETTAMPTEADEGKTVVNADGDEIGEVVEVGPERTYVDAHHSITDRIRSALGWGNDDEETYPVENEDVTRIEDDRVVVDTQRET